MDGLAKLDSMYVISLFLICQIMIVSYMVIWNWGLCGGLTNH
jgi:hypothetical protein